MLDSYLDDTIAALNASRSLAPEAKAAIDLMAESLSNSGKILVCGNGGSAADSAHFATELLCRYEFNRPSLPAVNLTADGSFLTAAGNDFNFAAIFARQIEGLGRKGDVLVVFTTSGTSKNVLEALRAARARGMKSVAFLGRGGGEALKLADVALVVPSQRTAHIQEVHQALMHYLCGQLENAMFPRLSLGH
jgi:D-sedoheptulose 7-phosphate isomerase